MADMQLKNLRQVAKPTLPYFPTEIFSPCIIHQLIMTTHIMATVSNQILSLLSLLKSLDLSIMKANYWYLVQGKQYMYIQTVYVHTNSICTYKQYMYIQTVYKYLTYIIRSQFISQSYFIGRYCIISYIYFDYL